jgi:hypothetical protein
MVFDRTSFIPETNKHQTQKKNECTHTLKHTRTEQYISAASNHEMTNSNSNINSALNVRH